MGLLPLLLVVARPARPPAVAVRDMIVRLVGCGDNGVVDVSM